LSTYADTVSGDGAPSTISAVPSKVTTSPPVPSSERWSETRGFSRMFGTFADVGMLYRSNVEPSQTNHTGELWGWPLGRTVVSHTMGSRSSRSSACACFGSLGSST
jgi:hypothetical protein